LLDVQGAFRVNRVWTLDVICKGKPYEFPAVVREIEIIPAQRVLDPRRDPDATRPVDIITIFPFQARHAGENERPRADAGKLAGSGAFEKGMQPFRRGMGVLEGIHVPLYVSRA
jgi:hypothetical protein